MTKELIALTVSFETGIHTPKPECKDMEGWVNYHLSQAAHNIARDVADHFGYSCTAKVEDAS